MRYIEKERSLRTTGPNARSDYTISLFWLSYNQILALFPNWKCPLAAGVKRTPGMRLYDIFVLNANSA